MLHNALRLIIVVSELRKPRLLVKEPTYSIMYSVCITN